jgi:hypothetical protein
MKLEDMKKLLYIIPVKHFYENTSNLERNGEASTVIVYQVFDSLFIKKNSNLLNSIPAKKKTINCSKKRFTFHNSTEEYPSISKHFQLPKLIGPRQLLIIKLNKINTSEQIYFIFTDRNGTNISVPIDAHSKTLEIPFAVGQKNGLFFIHNPSKKTFSFDFELIHWEQLKDIGIQKLTK